MTANGKSSAAAAMVAMRRIVRLLRLAEREVQSVCGLSVAQLFVLHHLRDVPALSIADLADRTLTDPSSVSTVVARLTTQGFVQRTPSRSDRRRAELSLTAQGERVVMTAPRVPQLAMIESIRALPPKRRTELVRSLEGLASAIGANAVEPRMLFEDEPVQPGKLAKRREQGRSRRGRAAAPKKKPTGKSKREELA